MNQSNYLMNTYAREAVSFIKGDGIYLWDDQNNQYMDTSAGIAVMNLGHSHPEIVQVIKHQAGQLMHVSNAVSIPQQTALAKTLTEVAGMDKVFFCNSGGEAMETAFKIARLFAHQQGYANPKVVSFKKSFHGRSFSLISAARAPLNEQLYSPLMPGFLQTPYNDVAALEEIIKSNDEVAAVMLEPIQGEGGVNVPDDGFLTAIRDLCDQHNMLMIMDEVQAGIGRTGQMFGYQHENVQPDVVASAKALGNGFPIGACLAKGPAAQLLTPGSHGSTFGGNPLACAVGNKVIEIAIRDNIVEHASKMGVYLLDLLQDKLGHLDQVKSIRGKGLMIGVELNNDSAHLRAKALHEGLVINVTQKHIIRLTPPLVINQPQCVEMVERLYKVIAGS